MAAAYPLQFPRATALDGLRKTSFSGIEFPVDRLSLHSTGRQHLHEYPHSPGAAPEKLGRGIYYLTASATFDVGLPGYAADLWPNGMNQLRALYETQQTATFVHPTVQEFQAFISAWRQEYNPRHRSGERVEIEFIEDQRSSFLTQTTPSDNAGSIAVAQGEMDAALSLVKSQLGMSQNDVSVFDAIRATSNAISALSDSLGMYSQFVQAKAMELQGFCAQADRLTSMQNPIALGVIDLMHTIWAGAVSITRAAQDQTKIGKWTTPRVMTVQDIAVRLYRDASRSSDILTLNATRISDPTMVPAGTTILYFLPAQTS